MQLPFFDANAMVGNTITSLPAPLLNARALLDEMDHFGIECSLFFHYALAGSFEGEYEMNALTLADAKISKRLATCWVIETSSLEPGGSLDDQAERIIKSGSRAARLYPEEGAAAGPVPLRPYLMGGILAGLQRYRIPLLIPESCLNVPQLGSGAYDPIEQLCAAFPRMPLVILEPRYNSAPLLTTLMRRHGNLYATITLFGLYHQLESMVAAVGADRLLFSTGLPQLDPSIAVGMLLYSSLPQKSLEMVAGGNLRLLLAKAGQERE